jgi:Ca-activated chloride channel family protein
MNKRWAPSWFVLVGLVCMGGAAGAHMMFGKGASRIELATWGVLGVGGLLMTLVGALWGKPAGARPATAPPPSTRMPTWVVAAGALIAALAGAAMLFLVSQADTVDARAQRFTVGMIGLLGVVIAIGGGIWSRVVYKRDAAAWGDLDAADGGTEPAEKWTAARLGRVLWPWALFVSTGLIAIAIASLVFDVPPRQMWIELKRLVHLAIKPSDADNETAHIVWKSPRAVMLAGGGALVAWLGFHLHRRRAATMGFSQVKLMGPRGVGAALSPLPVALRALAIFAISIGLARPETYRTIKRDIDSIDIVIVMDMSKSMEETDMPRDRMDAAQRVIRRFLRRNKNDRIGLVIFGQQAMLQCPLTHDTKILEKIVADLVIGDVPELGTAIGDGLALAVAQLRRSDAKSKVVILLSDGDSNWVTRFDPDEAARAAKDEKIKTYTILVGREETDLFGFGGMSVNPATLRNIANVTGGEFFRATDYESFDRGFQTVRTKLDTTKRTVTERVPDQQLFVPFALIGAALLLLELILSHTRLRRLP